MLKPSYFLKEVKCHASSPSNYCSKYTSACHSAGGNNRQACFYPDEDYQFYLEWLKDYADKTECRIHA
jgi:hypothetical protein